MILIIVPISVRKATKVMPSPHITAEAIYASKPPKTTHLILFYHRLQGIAIGNITLTQICFAAESPDRT